MYLDIHPKMVKLFERTSATAEVQSTRPMLERLLSHIKAATEDFESTQEQDSLERVQ